MATVLDYESSVELLDAYFVRLRAVKNVGFSPTPAPSPILIFAEDTGVIEVGFLWSAGILRFRNTLVELGRGNALRAGKWAARP